jgi:Terminase small subunit
VETEALANPQHEAFARYVAEGRSKRVAAILAGYGKKYASSQGTRLSKVVKISKRIAYLQGQVVENTVQIACKIFEFDLVSKRKRIEMYADMHERLWRIVKERAADPAMAKVPGGQSGFMLRTLRALGSGAHMKIIPEYVPDTALATKILAVAQQAAEELGQWKNDQQRLTADKVQYCWVDPEVVDVAPSESPDCVITHYPGNRVDEN